MEFRYVEKNTMSDEKKQDEEDKKKKKDWMGVLLITN